MKRKPYGFGEKPLDEKPLDEKPLYEKTLFDYAYTKYLKLGRGLVTLNLLRKTISYTSKKKLKKLLKSKPNENERKILECLSEYKPKTELVLFYDSNENDYNKFSVVLLPKESEAGVTKIGDIFSL